MGNFNSIENPQTQQIKQPATKIKTPINYWKIGFFIVLFLWFFSSITLIFFFSTKNSTEKNTSYEASSTSPAFIPSISPTFVPVNQVIAAPTPFPEIAKYYKKLIIILNNGNKIENFYTSTWFWCGGSKGERILSSNYSSFVELVGKTSLDQDVYILKENTPFPKDGHFIPSYKKTLDYLGENGIPVSKVDWGDFLSDQKNDYPMIIIKDSTGKMILYIRYDYLSSPGC